MPGITQGQFPRGRAWVAGALALAAVLCCAAPARPDVPPDQAADLLLDSARRAYNEKNYAFAATRFREFLGKYASHKNAPSAHYGLALALLDGPEKDYKAAVEQLQPLAGTKDFPDYPFVLYYLGLSYRGLGVRELALVPGKPQEAPAHRKTAAQHFEEAARQFNAAATTFQERAEKPAPDAKELPVGLEWVVRARCDQAEMLLRAQKAKEARDVVAPLLDDKALAKSRYRPLGLYYHGFASFLLQDYLAAGRSLNQLAPFADPVFGTHARYLVARVHHQDGERAEAAADYEAVVADHTKRKQAAEEALKQPDKFKNDPDEKARLETLARGPLPDHVARASFYLGVLHYENGRYAEARDRLGALVQAEPQSALAAEATLRIGFCQVQLKQPAEALKTLQPLADREPRLADQALLWIGKAQAASVEPDKGAPYDQALKTAIDTFRRAAEKAQQLTADDPEARSRRGEILLEMADAQQRARLFKDAVTTYQLVLNDKVLPQREEELLLGLATALHLAGDYVESDKVCMRYTQAHPRGTLLPAVLFRYAENAYFGTQAAEKIGNPADRAKELARVQDEAIKRYQAVVDKYPEFLHVNLARYGLAMMYYRKGDLEKARAVLATIPPAERTGDLALVPYVLADCALRLAPTRADDALAAGKMEEELKTATELLEGFVGAQAASPQAPDALLKLGLCHQRLAGLIAQAEERKKELDAARAAYDRLMQQYGTNALVPQAVLERAKCQHLAGDTNGAVNELRRFLNDPLKNAPVAPMGVLELATLLRLQNKAPEAVTVLAQCRQQQEPNLAKDPTRAGWVVLLQYHHALALREAGKLDEARALFETILKQSPNRPEAAEAVLRIGQCLKDDGLQKMDAARKKLAQANLKPEQKDAFSRELEAGRKGLLDACQYLEKEADGLKDKQPSADVRARMLYEAAWGCRTLADEEVTRARARLQDELWQKRRDEVMKKLPPGQTPAYLPVPEVPLASVPLQPAELKVRALYQALIGSPGDVPVATDARFELAELYGERGEHDAAIKLLKETLDKEPSPELAEKVRLRLGTALAARGDVKAALGNFQVVLQNPKSPLVGQASYRAGECYMQSGDWAQAVKLLAIFRDQDPFRNQADLADRALLRLGHALAQLKQWDQSRQAHEQVVGRFPNSPWANEARYGIGWAWQNQKQFDQAVTAFSQVTAQTTTEVAARAQLQIGLCRLEQKRFQEAATALLVVPFTYDYPELNAGALCEAARSLAELKQNEQAVRLLQRVLRDHPESKWADVARERLEGLKGG